MAAGLSLSLSLGRLRRKLGAFMKRYVDETQLPADYIVETGTASGWTYEKWLSGKYVCRTVKTETLSHYTTVGSFYGYVSSLIAYPISFPEIPIVHYNCKIGNGFAIPGGDVTVNKNSCRCYSLSTASGEVSCYWEIEVTGRWK